MRYVRLLSMFLVAHAACAEEWQELFNGHDLVGWQIVGEQDCWGVSDGLLSPTAPGGRLSTERAYSDFELSLEFRLAEGSNSGVFLRAPHEGRISRTGMEIQLIDEDAEMYRDLQGWQRCGALYHIAEPSIDAFTAAGEWQKLHVRAAGRKLQVTLNDRLIVDVDLDAFPEMEAEHPGLKRPSGYIGLQNYGGRSIDFRQVRLRELD